MPCDDGNFLKDLVRDSLPTNGLNKYFGHTTANNRPSIDPFSYISEHKVRRIQI